MLNQILIGIFDNVVSVKSGPKATDFACWAFSCACRTPKDALVQFKIALLKQQHAEILSAVAELTKLFAGPFEDAVPQLGTARTTLARLIAKHLKTEEEELHAPLRARGLTTQIPAFADIAAETRDLRLAYSAHIGDWHARTVQADWSGYTASARRLHAALEQLTKREEEEIYPAAQRLLSEPHQGSAALKR